MTIFVNDHNYEADAVWVERIRADYAPGLVVIPECSSGWDGLIRGFLNVVVDNLGKDSGFRISQIKEKFGGLRIYFHFPDDVSAEVVERINQAYDEAEKASWETCEISGQPGVLIERSRVLMVRSPEFIQEGDKVLTKNSTEDMAVQIAKMIGGLYQPNNAK